MAKRFNICYKTSGREIKTHFVSIELSGVDYDQVHRDLRKKHPKEDIIIKYIKEAKPGTSETL